MTVGFCVSGGGRVVEGLLAARNAGLLKLHGAVAVLDRQSPFVMTAARYKVPVSIVDIALFSNKELYREHLAQHLMSLQADCLFLTFNWILPPCVVKRYAGNIINLHMSALPLYPGRDAIRLTLASGARFAGITYHIADEGVDTGPMIAQAITPVLPAMTPTQLGFALFCRALPAGIQVMRWYEQGAFLAPVNRTVPIARAKFDSGPFFPALDADVIEFSEKYLRKFGNSD